MATVGRARQCAESQINSQLPRALYDEADEKEIDKVKGLFRAVANREPDRSNARRNESTSDENIFSRKVRRTAAWIESEAAPRENPTN